MAGYLIRLHTQYRAEQPEKPKRKRSDGVGYDSSLAEKTLSQFDSDGGWMGANPHGMEAYFKRLHSDHGDDYFEDEDGE